MTGWGWLSLFHATLAHWLFSRFGPPSGRLTWRRAWLDVRFGEGSWLGASLGWALIEVPLGVLLVVLSAVAQSWGFAVPAWTAWPIALLFALGVVGAVVSYLMDIRDPDGWVGRNPAVDVVIFSLAGAVVWVLASLPL